MPRPIGGCLAALLLFAPTAAPAQHAGLAASLNYTRSDDRNLGRPSAAKGFGAELIASQGEVVYGYASLDYYRGENGSVTAQMLVFNAGFKYWPKALEPGIRPWAGVAIGIGGAAPNATPVLLGGVGWKRRRGEVVPYLGAEYATRRERLHLKLGFMLIG